MLAVEGSAVKFYIMMADAGFDRRAA